MTPARDRVRATIVSGATVGARDALVAADLDPGQRSAAILEGLVDGRTTLLDYSDKLMLHRVAPACLCCTGNLVLRVTLNRILRLRPDRLYIGVANVDHLDQLRSWLQTPPYDQLLELTPDLL
ncbi:MAG: GTPase [Pseudomonadota bacterium]